MKFNLQLFADAIPGIDADILKELGVEETTQEETQKEETAPEKAPEQPEAEANLGEADTVKKQVENTEPDEYDDLKDSKTIPYDRFKSVNDRRKTAESRIKELEEKLKSYENRPQQQEQQPAPATNVYEYTAEQRKKIGELAVQRAKEKLGYTDEDVEALEYADDMTEKMMYQNAVAQETQAISQEIQAFKTKQQNEQNMYAQNVNRFNELNAKVAAYPDAQARLDFIMNENFNKLDSEKQLILQESFSRLQNKQGTNADFRLINSYFTRANKLWDDAHSVAPTNTTNNKIAQAQKLPKAPNINGGGGNDKVYTVAELTELLNSPDGWDALPEKVKQQILKGNMPV